MKKGSRFTPYLYLLPSLLVVICFRTIPILSSFTASFTEYDIGGFHGFDDYPILKNVRLIVPCHCTQHQTEIQQLYPDRCEIGFVGKIITI